MSLSEAVKNAINAELPNQVANELKIYIQETEGAKAEATLVNKKYNDLNSEYRALDNKYQELFKLNLRKEELDERERNLKVETAGVFAKESEKRADMIFSLVDRIFRNSEVKRTLTGNVPVMVPPGGPGMSSYVTTQSVQESTNESVE